MSDFKFFLEADMDIQKSRNGETRRVIKGYASTEHMDRQKESMVQKGLDISDLVNHGFFNYDHNNKIIVGYPYETCRVDENGLWVEGELLKGIDEADRMWDLSLALKKSKAPRKVGFSVEGKILERQGNRIVKAKIYNVAVTPNPVNTNCTWDAVVKSFNGQDDFTPEEDPFTDKSLTAGYEVNPPDMEGGAVFRKESLEKDLHNLSYVIGNEANKNILKQELTSKSLSNREALLYLFITKGWSAKKSEQFLKSQQLD